MSKPSPATGAAVARSPQVPPETDEPQDGVLVIARGGGTLFAGRLFTWGVRFALAIVLARTLNADGYGLYNLAIGLATLVATFPPIGLDTALVRFTATAVARGQPDVARANVRWVLLVSGALSVVAALGLVAFAAPVAELVMHDARLAPLLIIASLAIPGMVLNRHLGAFLQGVRRLELGTLAEQFGQPLARAILIAGLLIAGMTVAGALSAWVAATFVATAMLAYFAWRYLPAAGGREERPQRGQMLRFSLPVFFSNIVTSVGENLQTIFLGLLSTVSAVGVFGVSNQLNLIGSMFHSSVVSASMALFAETEARGDRRGLESLYQTVSKWSLSLNVPLFLAVVLFPDALLSLFGPEFREGATALVILAFANIINAATGASGAVLDMTGHSVVKLVNASVALGLAVGLNLLLIPTYGLVGAAIAVLASSAAVNVLRITEVYLLLRTTPYNRSFLKPVAAGLVGLAAAVAVRLLLPDAPAAQALVGIGALFAAYAFTLTRLGLSAEDRLVMNRVWNKVRRRRRRAGKGGQ
jgi:O-antigen/teichoic acid export membrane protein